MTLTWSPEALEQLIEIYDFIFEDSPVNAGLVIDQLETFPNYLIDNPLLGRKGRKEDTRELLHGDLPYFVVYRIKNDEIQILEVQHYRQDYK